MVTDVVLSLCSFSFLFFFLLFLFSQLSPIPQQQQQSAPSALSTTGLEGLTKNDFTVEAWIRPMDSQNADTRRTDLISRGSWSLSLRGGQTCWFALQAGTSVCSEGDVLTHIDRWIHLAATISRGTTVQLFLNGKVVAQKTMPTKMNFVNDVSLTKIGGSSLGNFFYGDIDDVALFGRSLTSQHLKRHVAVSSLSIFFIHFFIHFFLSVNPIATHVSFSFNSRCTFFLLSSSLSLSLTSLSLLHLSLSYISFFFFFLWASAMLITINDDDGDADPGNSRLSYDPDSDSGGAARDGWLSTIKSAGSDGDTITPLLLSWSHPAFPPGAATSHIQGGTVVYDLRKVRDVCCCCFFMYFFLLFFFFSLFLMHTC